ncbi:MAG: TRIC cation channel family protein [Opitutales bacterium]|nr:TRIC cation channel family protein [Opitutales bacterium]
MARKTPTAPFPGKAWARLGRTCLFLFLGSLFSTLLNAQETSPHLDTGIFERAPYQYEEERGGFTIPTGLDVSILQAIGEEAGFRPRIESRSWSDQLTALQEGQQDIVFGAYYDPDRLPYARYSIPYRTEDNTLFVNSIQRTPDDLQSIEDFINWLKEDEITLGVARGFIFADPDLENFVRAPENQQHLLERNDKRELLQALAAGEIQALVGAPLVIDLMLRDQPGQSTITRHPLDLGETKVFLMYSRESLSVEQMNRLDEAIKTLRDSGKIQNIKREFLLPTFLAIITNQGWFFVLNMMGVIAFSLSGILLARKGRYNFFGALILAATPALGGGLVRDVLLGVPVYFFETPLYLFVVLALVSGGTAIFKAWDALRHRYFQNPTATERWALKLYDHLFKIFDAWAVAASTIVGVSVAAEHFVQPLWLWGPLLGVITASFGVILRDMIRADHDILLLKKDSYGEMSILLGTVYSICLLQPFIALSTRNILIATMLLTAAGFALRVLIIYGRIPNPLNLGNSRNAPEKRFGHFEKSEPKLWTLLETFIPESGGHSLPLTRSELENQHLEFFYQVKDLHEMFRDMTREPLGESEGDRLLRLQSRLERLRLIEEDLYAVATGGQTAWSPLDQAFWESLHAVIDTVATTLEDPDPLAIELLTNLATADPKRFEELRQQHRDEDSSTTSDEDSLQRTYRFQRIFILIAEYVNLYITDRNQNEQ